MWNRLNPRLLGLCIVLLAGLGLAVYVAYPLYEAGQGRRAVSLHPVITLACGPLIALGLWQLLSGAREPWRDPATGSMTRLGMVLITLALAGGGALYWWLDRQLAALGY